MKYTAVLWKNWEGEKTSSDLYGSDSLEMTIAMGGYHYLKLLHERYLEVNTEQYDFEKFVERRTILFDAGSEITKGIYIVISEKSEIGLGGFLEFDNPVLHSFGDESVGRWDRICQQKQKNDLSKNLMWAFR